MIQRHAIWMVLCVLMAFCGSVSLADAAPCIPHRDANGKIQRSRVQVVAFKLANPCPANGNTRGPCPGYIVDHVKALCVCGKDRPFNMQWQTVAEAKKKDRVECLVRQMGTP